VCVPRIAAAYRGTKRKLPAHPFGYVRATLTPLAELLRASDAVDLAALGGREEKEEQQQREVEAHDWMADDVHNSAGSVSTPSPSSLLPSSARSAVVTTVLARLTADFDSRAKECLADVVRLEELSKKLGKRPTAGAAATAPGERNDAEKTRAQLDLDAKQYVKLIQEQLAPPNAEKMLQPLLQTTQPAHA
jgi:hypothetical protein